MKPIKYSVKRQTLLTHGESKEELIPPPDLPVQILKRFVILFDRYKIKLGNFDELALALAFAHEPEFAVEIDRGHRRKTKPTLWNPARYLRLWFDVTRVLTESPRHRPEWACNKVAKRPEWADAGVNVRRYYEALKTPLVRYSVNVRKHLGDDMLMEGLEIDWAGLLQDLEEVDFNSK